MNKYTEGNAETYADRLRGFASGDVTVVADGVVVERTLLFATAETLDALRLALATAHEHLREIARVADTLSPQEFINHAASGGAVERHEYSGAMDPNRSIVELTRQVADLQARCERLGVKP